MYEDHFIYAIFHSFVGGPRSKHFPWVPKSEGEGGRLEECLYAAELKKRKTGKRQIRNRKPSETFEILIFQGGGKNNAGKLQPNEANEQNKAVTQEINHFVGDISGSPL